jgi:hypothetical protein
MHFHCVEVASIAEQENACGNRLPEEFVEVDGNRVGQCEACELVAMLCREQQSAAISGIDMKPCTGGSSQARYFVQRVDRAEIRGSSGGDDSHGEKLLTAKLMERVAQRGGIHTEIVVNANPHNGTGSEA